MARGLYRWGVQLLSLERRRRRQLRVDRWRKLQSSWRASTLRRRWGVRRRRHRELSHRWRSGRPCENLRAEINLHKPQTERLQRVRLLPLPQWHNRVLQYSRNGISCVKFD